VRAGVIIIILVCQFGLRLSTEGGEWPVPGHPQSAIFHPRFPEKVWDIYQLN
jgi:hypothetical protein